MPTSPVKITRRRAFGRIARELLVFESGFEPIEPRFRDRYYAHRDYRPLHTVYARRLRPPGSEGRPRLVYLHGYMQPETVVEELGLLAVMAKQLHVEVIHVQVPHHGRRRLPSSRLSGDLYWTSDMVRSAEALRQTLLDARAVIAWLRAEDSARPIGVAGISMGGVHSLALACLEPQLDFAFPCIAHMDIAAMTADAPVLGAMRQRMREDGWTQESFARGVGRTAWSQLELAMPSERVMLFAAERDGFFRPALVRQMWRRFGEPAIRWYPTSHMGFIPRLPGAFLQMRRFIDAL